MYTEHRSVRDKESMQGVEERGITLDLAQKTALECYVKSWASNQREEN